CSGSNDTGSVSLTGRADADLVIDLSSADTSELVVPPTVTIPAGQTNVSFTLSVVDDAELDGTQSVLVTAARAGFPAGTATLEIADNDSHHFSVEVMSDPKFAGFGFPIVVTAYDVNAEGIPAYTTGVSLSASGVAGPLTVS